MTLNLKSIFKYSLLFVFIAMIGVIQSCSKDDTYADLRNRENKQILSFLKNGIPSQEAKQLHFHLTVPINVINEKQFIDNNFTTDTLKNQYVLLNSGVYMQIVRQGSGEKLKNDETATLLVRYIEYNIAEGKFQSTNRITSYVADVEKMIVTNKLGNISGTFIPGLMKSLYSSVAVPSGWLIPLKYVNIGRQISKDKGISLVRLIVPSTQGQEDAANKTYPCFYEISYQRER